MTTNHIWHVLCFMFPFPLYKSQKRESLNHHSSSPDNFEPLLEEHCQPVLTSSWGSSRSYLQLEPLLQEHCRPVLASSWGLLVLTFSWSPSPKNIVDLFSPPVGVFSFSPSVGAPPPTTLSTCSRLQ